MAVGTEIQKGFQVTAEPEGTKAVTVWNVFRLYFPNFAGSAVQGQLVLGRLNAKGISVRVITSAEGSARDLAGNSRTVDGLIVDYLPSPPGIDWSFVQFDRFRKLLGFLNSLIGHFVFSLRTISLIRKAGREGDIIQFHSINEFSFLVAWFAKRKRLKSAVLMTLYGSDDPQSLLRLRSPTKYLKLKAFEYADAIIALCTAQQRSVEALGRFHSPLYKIPCAVNTGSYAPVDRLERAALRAELGLERDAKYIVFVGSAIIRKGIDRLIRAFILLASAYDNLNLIVVGENRFEDRNRYSRENKSRLESLIGEIRRSGLLDRVVWTGVTPDVNKYLRAGDLFCLPTRREGFGIVIVEAMSAGLPCVVSRLEGVTTDIIQSNINGLLIDGDEPEAIADGLRSILDDPQLAAKFAENARLRAVEFYDVDIITASFIQVYRQLSPAIFSRFERESVSERTPDPRIVRS